MTELRSSSEKESQASRLLSLAEQLELFKTPGGEAYARLPKGETYLVKSQGVRDWLVLAYGDQHPGQVPSKTALEGALEMLGARARLRGDTAEVHVRVAWQAGTLYLDLHENGIVEVTREGWRVVTDAPVRFRRPRGALALPMPERGGTLSDLRPFLDIATDEDWALVAGWLLGALHPTGPYAVLALHAEKGCGKSTMARYLRSLVDPSEAMLLSPPKDREALTLKGYNNSVLSFDNLSTMPRWLSDAICRTATGTADSKRELYANTDEVILATKRPFIINGIAELATEGDLLDRLVSVTLPRIPDDARKSETEQNARFNERRPYILGALLDAAVAALANWDRVRLTYKPRLLDFAKWVAAAEQEGKMGCRPGTFERAYRENRESTVGQEIEASAVARAVVAFMSGRTEWTGTATQLLKLLAEVVDYSDTHHWSWPKDGTRLSGELNRVAGALRSQGIDIERAHSGGRHLTLRNQKVDRREDLDGDGRSGRSDSKDSSFLSKEEEERGAIGNRDRTASTASGKVRVVTRAEFLTQVARMGLTVRQAMERLGVRTLEGLDLDAALDTLRKQMQEDDDIPF